jgi:hypothetical protein
MAEANYGDVYNIYMNNLGRAPSEADVQNWVGKDYGSLATSLANEPEVQQNNQPFWTQPGTSDQPASTPAPAANPWQQTVNDIYQQEFGRQADESGMASFTAQLNAGMTGEQMREALRSSAEGQLIGTSAAPVAPLTPAAYTPFNLNQYGSSTNLENDYYNSAYLANWQMEQGRPDMARSYIEQANALKTQLDLPYRIDTLGGGGGGDAGESSLQTYLIDRDGNIVANLDPSGDNKYSAEMAGTGDAASSTFSDEFTLEDILKQAETKKSTPFGANAGQATGYAYELKNANGEIYKRFDAQGNLTNFLDRETDEWTKASDVKPVGVKFDPMTGTMVTEYEYKGRRFAPTEGSGGISNSVIDPFDEDTGGFMGEGGWSKVGALVAAGLTAGVASGALVPASVAAAAPGSAAAIGLSAAKGALTSIAISGLQGATPAQMLKSGLIGAVTAGAGTYIGTAGLSAAEQYVAKVGLQTGLTAASGGDAKQALVSAIVTNALPIVLKEVLPANITSAISQLPKPVQTVLMSTASSVLNAGFNGRDISDAAINGVTNGLISVGKDIASGAFKGLSESELAQKVKGYLTPETTAGGFLGEYKDMAPALSGPDVINSIFQQDAQEAMNRDLPKTPPLVQNAIDQNTPRTVDNVVTPPLVQQAMDQSNADAIYNQLVANYDNSTVGAPLGTLAGATTRDVDPVALAPNRFSSSGPVSVSWNEPDAKTDDSDVNPVTVEDRNVPQNEFLSPEEMRDLNGTPIPSGSGITLKEWLQDKLSGGGFKSSPLAQESPQKYGSDVPQVDAQGNPIRTFEPRESYSTLSQFGQGSASVLDNTVGGILPMATQLVSYLGLRTYDEILQAVSSMVESDYKANPEEVRVISHKLAGLLSQPFGKAGDVIASQVTGRKDDVTGSKAYEREITGQVLRGVDSALNTGADYLSDKTGLPAGDVRFMTDLMLLRPGQTAALAREGITATKDVGRGYADAAIGVVNESPTGAYNLGASVADLTRAPDTSLMRGESPTRNINLGEIIDEAPSYVSPERLSAPTPALGYSPTEVAAAPRDVASIFNDAFEAADRIPTYDVKPQPTATPATQLAPESRGALPTTLAEPAIRPIDLGPNLDSSSLATITELKGVIDQSKDNRAEPQRQAQELLVDTTVKTYAPEGVKPSVIDFWNKTFTEGAYSDDVIDGIKNTFDNKAAPPEVILEQVDKATQDLKNLDEQLPAKLEMLSNASKLGITPAEAIKLGLLNNNGRKTELGEKVLPTTEVQPKTDVLPKTDVFPKIDTFPKTDKKFWDEVLPPLVIKPPIIKPPIIKPPPPGINPPIINPPVINPPIENPPIDVVPPIDINPPIINPPPLIQAAITPPKAAPKVAAPAAPATAVTPSYMYSGVGSQGSGPGALPGNLQSTFLQGVNVNEYNPFENYNVYQQLGSPPPVRAAEGGSPLQLAQMQQGVAGIDPRLYSMLQKRATPNYFTYGIDTSGGNPTTFAGSQLMGKPTPGIPVIPTGQKAGSDWLYQGSGTNPLAMAGTGIPSLPGGMMAQGGQAHGGGEGEHIPEFITGATGHYVRGRGDGTSDEIPAMLANNEYVFDADTVAALGNGSSDAGAAFLDKFREAVRSHKRSAPADKIPPKASPLQYVKEAMKNHGS